MRTKSIHSRTTAAPSTDPVTFETLQKMAPEARAAHFVEQLAVLTTEDRELSGKIAVLLGLFYKPRQEDVDAEITRLDELRRFCDGEAHDDIAAQLRVLCGQMSYEQTCEEFQDGRSMDAAGDAWQWANGEVLERYRVAPPSSIWADRLQRAA